MNPLRSHPTWRLLPVLGLTSLLLLALFAALTLNVSAAPDVPLANDLRLSQVYGGGGGSGYYLHDYVELFNAGASPVDLTGWSLQYGSATGNFASTLTNLYAFPNGTVIPAGKYLLVQLGTAGTSGIALPVTPDLVTTNLNMSAASGKVALANIATALGCGANATPCTLPDSRIVDLVAYGASNNAEGGVPVNNGVALNNQQGAVRKAQGCQDTDVNNDDFDVLTGIALQPRNSSSPAYSCSGAPSVLETNPADGATNVPINATIAITFSEPVTVTTNWFTLACTSSGSLTGTTAPASPSATYVVTPASLFAYDETCTFTVLADEVTNSGGLTLTADFPFTFTTESLTGDITFVYYDLEDVVQPGESIYLAGSFNGWNPNIPLTANAASSVFSVTVPGLAANTYFYKYVVSDTVPAGPQWDWLNTNDRTLAVSGNATVNDYRNVQVVWANLQWPPTATTNMGQPTPPIYGQLYIPNITDLPGEGRGLRAQVGYGTGANPASWAWFPMSFNTQVGNNDEFMGVITPTLPGSFAYATRYDANWGSGNPNAGWTYASLNGIPFDIDQTGQLTVGFVGVPIADARAGSNGQLFALEGQVIATNNTWNNAPEWAFQDASGGIAAFFIPAQPIALGDTVRMVATRGSFNNQEQMVAPVLYFEVVGPGAPLAPITYTTGAVASGVSEGWLVEIEGVVGNMPTTCGSAYNITLNDGSGPATVRIESATGINLCNLGIQNGDMLGVVGFSTQFQTTYQVKPRSVADLRLFVDNPFVLQTTPANNATNVLTNTQVIIRFSEPVTVTTNWFTINCSSSGPVAASSAPAGPTDIYTLTPTTPFAFGEICSVAVLADQVTNDLGLNMLADYRFSFTTGPALPFGACGDTAVPIHFIQGSGATTPIFGTTVVVEGVVVGSYQGAGQFNGFFLQSRDDDADNDPMTSEGIFVFGSALQAVAPGDLVRVRGTATEFNNLTQVGSVSNLAVCASGQSVTPAQVTLPVASMMDWEALEGMLLSFTQELVVTEHYNLARFGELMLSVNDRLWNPTNVVAPGAPALALQALNNRSRIMLDDGLNTQNPATVIYPDPGLTYTNTLRTGARVPALTGVLDYRANAYRIQPVGIVSFTNTADRPPTPDVVSGTLRIASFNVLNYFTTIDTGAFICGPAQNMECRGADSPFEFERQRAKILNTLLAIDADVVGLIEIENHVADDALIDLVAGLNDLAGAGTYAYINTGVIGTDAIKLAFIYKPATVTPFGSYLILDSSVDPRFLDTKNRPTLIQTFEENSTGERVTVAVNHLKSKGSPCDDVGDPDIGDGQGNCNLTRLGAAQALADYLATDPTGSGSGRFLIIGDMNAYAMEDPIMALTSVGYTDLLRHFYGDEAYTYVFDGQAGHLDHALASASLLSMVTGATVWHTNADEPRALDYNVEFKSAQQILNWYSPEPFRASDHDPVIVGLAMYPVVTPTVTIVTPLNGEVFTSTDGTAVTVPVVITTTNFAIPADGHWHLLLNGVDQGPVFDYDTTVSLLPGVYAISAELNTPDHVSLGVIDTVTVTVVLAGEEGFTLYLPLIIKPATPEATAPAAPVVANKPAWPAMLIGLPMLVMGLPLRRRAA